MLIFERYRAQLNTLKNRVEARLKAIGHAVADRVDKDPWETLSKMGLLPVQPKPPEAPPAYAASPDGTKDSKAPHQKGH